MLTLIEPCVEFLKNDPQKVRDRHFLLGVLREQAP
jgi:hypothetical protein